MTYAHLNYLQDRMFEAEQAGDDVMVQCYQREIDSIEILLGEMEIEKGRTNV